MQCRAINKKYKQSEKGKERNKKYKKSEKGKDANKRARESEAGKENVKKATKRRLAVTNSDPNVKLQARLLRSVSNFLGGSHRSCGTFTKTTGTTPDQLKAHFGSFSDKGFTLDNHGTAWSIDHRIPQRAYLPPMDGKPVLDIENAKRCYSLANMHPMPLVVNQEKQDKLIDEEMEATGVANLPTHWKGKIPYSEEEKQKLYEQWKADSEERYRIANADRGSCSKDVEAEAEEEDVELEDIPESGKDSDPDSSDESEEDSEEEEGFESGSESD